ncbi:hypothetical protein [Wolinella succinogenes]|uniref:hypothetical protein n=1 Tax=Wolinella succinogenes TaxID=844 RepID=UPI0024096481|nr:hypothetical protein [Wolinella succinogenes]
MRKTVVIGDVHGCFFTLKRLKKKNPELLEGFELQIQENPASPSLSRLLLTL